MFAVFHNVLWGQKAEQFLPVSSTVTLGFSQKCFDSVLFFSTYLVSSWPSSAHVSQVFVQGDMSQSWFVLDSSSSPFPPPPPPAVPKTLSSAWPSFGHCGSSFHRLAEPGIYASPEHGGEQQHDLNTAKMILLNIFLQTRLSSNKHTNLFSVPFFVCAQQKDAIAVWHFEWTLSCLPPLSHVYTEWSEEHLLNHIQLFYSFIIYSSFLSLFSRLFLLYLVYVIWQQSLKQQGCLKKSLVLLLKTYLLIMVQIKHPIQLYLLHIIAFDLCSTAL